jgi:hypothetical protein
MIKPHIFDYQQKLADDIHKQMEARKPFAYHIPTGSGYFFVLHALVDKHKSLVIDVLVHKPLESHWRMMLHAFPHPNLSINEPSVASNWKVAIHKETLLFTYHAQRN